MIHHRPPTQYAIEIEKQIFTASSTHHKQAIINAMDQYHKKNGYPNIMGPQIHYSVRITHIAQNKMYTYNIAASAIMNYEIKKEL